MLDLSKIALPIAHKSEGVSGIARKEIYQLGDIVYTEMYDGLSDKFVVGHIKMYGDVKVCTVYPDGIISLSVPTNWVTNHKK